MAGQNFDRASISDVKRYRLGVQAGALRGTRSV